MLLLTEIKELEKGLLHAGRECNTSFDSTSKVVSGECRAHCYPPGYCSFHHMIDMVREPPDFCHRCGNALSAVDPPATFHCNECEREVSYFPIPTTRIAVVDGGSILLVKVDTPDRDLWGTPGGLVEPGEDPAVAGVRELEEETMLSADPDDLVFFDARTFAKFGTMHKTYIAYAVAATDVKGEPQADHEIVEARYWTPAEFEAADDRLLTSWPEPYKQINWWLENAHTALERS